MSIQWGGRVNLFIPGSLLGRMLQEMLQAFSKVSSEQLAFVFDR